MNPAQPVAAAVVLNTGGDNTTAAGSQTAVDTQDVSGGGPVLPIGSGSVGWAQSAKDALAAKPASATAPPQAPQQSAQTQAPSQPDRGSSGSNNANQASADDNKAGAAPNGNPKQSQSTTQTQAQTNSDPTGPAGPATALQPAGDRAASIADAITGAKVAAPTAPSAAAATSASANALPNFGFVAANAVATVGAPPASTTGTAVPLAGLAVTIAAHAQAGSNHFDIRLDPPELGRIDVRLSVDGSGQVSSHVTVDRADTLQLLQSQQPQLERALEQAGLKTADNGLQFTLRDQSFAGQNSGGGHSGGQASAAQIVVPDAELAPVGTAEVYSRLRLRGGLDIRV